MTTRTAHVVLGGSVVVAAGPIQVSPTVGSSILVTDCSAFFRPEQLWNAVNGKGGEWTMSYSGTWWQQPSYWWQLDFGYDYKVTRITAQMKWQYGCFIRRMGFEFSDGSYHLQDACTDDASLAGRPPGNLFSWDFKNVTTSSVRITWANITKGVTLTPTRTLPNPNPMPQRRDALRSWC